MLFVILTILIVVPYLSSKMLQIVIMLLYFQLHLISCDDDLYSKFQQHDYKVEFTRLELVNYNKDVYSKYEIVTFKYNRSMAVANVTFQQKVHLNSTKINVVIQVYKFLSNEYRIFPIHFQLNLCRLSHQNIAGFLDALRRCGNVNSCYMKKDVVYHICNIYPDQSRFPPLIPTGEFKVELTLVYGNLTLSVINAYGRVFRPIKNYE